MDSTRSVATWLLYGLLLGIGIPLAATFLFSPLMQAWTPIAVLLLLGLIVLWLVGIGWMIFVAIAMFTD